MDMGFLLVSFVHWSLFSISYSFPIPPWQFANNITNWWLSIKLLSEDEARAESAVVYLAVFCCLLLVRLASWVALVVLVQPKAKEPRDSSRVPGCSRYDRSSHLPSLESAALLLVVPEQGLLVDSTHDVASRSCTYSEGGHIRFPEPPSAWPHADTCASSWRGAFAWSRSSGGEWRY